MHCVWRDRDIRTLYQLVAVMHKVVVCQPPWNKKKKKKDGEEEKPAPVFTFRY